MGAAMGKCGRGVAECGRGCGGRGFACREEHGGVTRQRRARAVAQHVQHHRPERVRWGGAEDGVGGA